MNYDYVDLLVLYLFFKSRLGRIRESRAIEKHEQARDVAQWWRTFLERGRPGDQLLTLSENKKDCAGLMLIHAMRQLRHKGIVINCAE